MNAVIYARYSSDSQREESIEGQLRECREYAERNNMTIVGTYIDRALSAKTADRPEFQHMIKDSAKELFEIVLVWKLDRFSRDRYDSAHYKHILKKNGVKVISAKEHISEGPEGIILEAMLEGYAEFYSAELSEKIHRGQKENALKGKNNGGGVPLGYLLDKKAQKLVIDPVTAPLVVEISIKTIIFFVGWAICVSVIPIPDTASAVIWRFWAELIPLLSVIAITLIFWLADQKKIRLHLTGKPVYNIILGGVTGTIWLGASVGILSILGVVQIEGKNQIAMLWLWLLAAFLNTVMQEMLVRGYLYQMIKSSGSIAAAIIVSTGLFTFAHGGAFEAGILPVLNVITMSLFMTAVLEYTGSLIAPIVIHFLWNGVGAIILGGVSLAEDYPHLFDMTIHGNPILSGGSCKIEGSIIVLFMNLAFLIGFVAAKKRKDRNR